ENKRLDLALAVTPGATASTSAPLLYVEPPGDEYLSYPYALEVNAANVLALRAACLAWSPEARQAALRLAPSDAEVVRIKRLMVDHLAGEIRQALASS